MSIEECIGLFERFKFYLHLRTDDSLLLRDQFGNPVGFQFPKDVTPDELKALARDFIRSHGFDLPD
jgi:hypothetical protein